MVVTETASCDVTACNMEHYSKGKNVEEPLIRGSIPIPGLPEDFLWMHVSGGSKMRNLLTFALKAFNDQGVIVWSGSGVAIGKTISCAEIIKRNFKEVHQITKICSRKVEEHWVPKFDNLDPLVVIRDVPTIHILLSKDPLNKDEPGYQPPGSCDVFWKANQTTNSQKRSGPFERKSKTPRVSTQQFAAMGLRIGGKRNAQASKKKQTAQTKPGSSRGWP